MEIIRHETLGEITLDSHDGSFMAVVDGPRVILPSGTVVTLVGILIHESGLIEGECLVRFDGKPDLADMWAHQRGRPDGGELTWCTYANINKLHVTRECIVEKHERRNEHG